MRMIMKQPLNTSRLVLMIWMGGLFPFRLAPISGMHGSKELITSTI
jgi:hypothetical protein